MAKKKSNKVSFFQKVKSTNLESVRYHSTLGELTVNFVNGTSYSYKADKSIYDKIVEMEKKNKADNYSEDKHLSIGKYFDEAIIKAGIKSINEPKDPAAKKV